MVVRNYAQDKDKIKRFLSEYCLESLNDNLEPKYKEQLNLIANRESNVLSVELDDVFKFDQELCNCILGNTKRYENIFNECVLDILADYKTKENLNKSTLDIFIEHRKIAEQISQRQNQESTTQKLHFPPDLLRNFDVHFTHLSSQKLLSIRQLLAEKIGKLVKFRGIVTRSTEVKPLITIAAYLCDRCGAETFQTVTGSSFTPADACPTPDCAALKTSQMLHLQSRGSKFVKHQELKIQELSDEVPAGHVPRYVTVAVYGDLTRIALPGNHVSVTGIFLPVAKRGFKQIISGLITDVYVEAHNISVTCAFDIDDAGTSLNEDQTTQLLLQDNLYDKLSASIAPEIFGHDDIKKALLLLMVGGVDQNPRGLKIRGNINILLVGDPGVAKSQLLSYINRITPRSQLTTGKGSSGVGLTAAVLRDPLTGELVLEGGALVLSDLGICCIDEFDKMDDNDRTAIHEVMEQQTVSIAKAGIITTLNARVSVLAAANPTYGRYNPKKTVEQNIQLPAALLSRFDLIWVIRDKPDRQNDQKLAQHITYVHKNHESPPAQYSAYPINTLRSFIQSCKRISPVIPEHLKDFIVSNYTSMRRESRAVDDNSTYMSARTLLSILRLSTALARLRHSKLVAKEDVQEAIRLMDCSKSSVSNEGTRLGTSRPHDVIFGIIRELAQNQSSTSISYDEVKQLCVAKGFNLGQISKCVKDYQDLNVLHINENESEIILV